MSISPSGPTHALPAAFADLRMFRAFQHFPDDRLVKLAVLAKERTIDRGRPVYTHGEASQDIYVVVSGGVDAIRQTPLGPQVITHSRTGSLFGEISFVDRKPRPVEVQANQDTLLLRFDVQALRGLLVDDKAVAVDFLRSVWYSLAGQMRQCNQLMTEVFTPGIMMAPTGSSASGETVEINPGAKLDLFSEKDLSAAGLRLLAATLPAERFAPNQFIFVEGDRGNNLYIVIEGKVRISRQMPGMGEEALAILGRGEIFGELALIDDQPRSADAHAHVDGCTVLSMNQRDLEEIWHLPAEAASQFLWSLCSIMTSRLRTMIELLISWRVMAGFGN